MDGPPAQSLGVEPPDESVTKSRKPRNAKESIINREVFSRVLLSAACIVHGLRHSKNPGILIHVRPWTLKVGKNKLCTDAVGTLYRDTVN